MAAISIAIPAWEAHGRGAEFITFLLQSIASQRVAPHEVCISDQSEDDAVRDAVDTFQSDHPGLRIRWQRNKEDRGNSSANTNAAIAMCTGDIVKIMFQDDAFVALNALGRTRRAFADPLVSWCVLPGTQMSSDGTRYHTPKLAVWTPKVHAGVNTIGSPSVIAVRRSHLLKCTPLFDPQFRYLMDCDAYCRLATIFGPPAVVDGAPCVGNREHPGQATHRPTVDHTEFVRMQEEKAACKTRWEGLMQNTQQTPWGNNQRQHPRAGQSLRGLCINLAHRQDRWQIFQEHRQSNATVQSFFSRVKRFEAVRGVDIAPNLPSELAGALGCALSHIRALHQLASTASNPNELVMVIEDDIEIVSPDALRQLMQCLPVLATSSHWMILLLAFSTARVLPLPDAQLARLGLVRLGGAMTTTGYIIRVRHIPALSRVFQQAAMMLRSGRSRREAAIDVQWLPLQERRIFAAFRHKLAIQRPGHSDIEGQHTDYTRMFASAGRQHQQQQQPKQRR